MATRKYQKKRRAEQESETRGRIVEAVYALHGEIGPARTTIKAIADRAGVERLTVYRHFADEGAIFAACDAHFRLEIPPPDPAAWAGIVDPAERLGAALMVREAPAPGRVTRQTSCNGTSRRRLCARSVRRRYSSTVACDQGPPLLDRDFPARPRHIRTATSTVYRRGQEAR